MKEQVWLGCPATFTMLRREFRTKDLDSVLKDVSEWLGCDEEFITSSFAEERKIDTSVMKKRYFERHHQRHATIILEIE